ncbi:bifunctional riboflavin kinase/FAD synthetase [Aureibaculum sp. 2210JD6-5]|uniref:bifunctional riboflavin kinase/FAD synthetase n=1 Tax=Aureibaculum sp. 2210JD6-5 TaxID=3103957 RepID=UPI002AAC92B6|nr:bifunctional riboflavin kinase/FAD synthetase [Aureibaculum sp. 2210JD6-5]MDY7395733.1 bifunctional riboflavin kinase/FAD synthetase [Aureibaculum sp. 2210JD6-5]
MQIYRSIKQFTGEENTSIITIGTFDGVHIGHQEIIKNLIKQGSKSDLNSVILTFFPHPRMVLQQGTDLKLLTTLSEKIALLEKTGLQNLVIEPFTKEFSRLTALDFVRDILIKRLKLKKLVIGYDHHFGRNREGNFKQLQEYGSLYGFTVEEIPAQDIKDISVSSTKIRNALLEGNIKKANSFLGYEYLLTGEIVHGKGLGNKYNYPTINIHIEEPYKLIPKPGVYIVKTKLKDENLFGIMNIGFRPTVNGKHQTIEVHLLDFNENLYGETISISIAHRLRDEQKFDSLEDLFSQIKEDEKLARKLIETGKISFR